MTDQQGQQSPPPSGKAEAGLHRIQVWDIATRLFHWALVACVAVSFVTGIRGITAMTYHEWSGVTILVLLLFRIVWGFFGSEESRFNAFVRGPAAVFRHAATLLKPDAPRHLGHNPLGGWSVVLLLAALLVQVGTGLFANDDILTEGPLFDLVDKDTSDWLTGIHLLNRYILLGLIAVHVGAIFFYLVFKRENLILPMITGVKRWPEDRRPFQRSGWPALVIIAFLALAVYGFIYGLN